MYKFVKKILESLRETDPRNAAEYAYALAMLYKHEGDMEESICFGREAIALFARCPMDTLADCAARNNIIEGVVIPGVIHEKVVRNNLFPLIL